MKSCSTLLIALGLVSSAVLAQSSQPAPEPAPGRMPETGATMPPPAMGSETQAPAATEDGGAQSSGASDMQTAPSGGGGQLITPDIAQSSPAAETTGVAVKSHTENGVTYMCGGIGDDEVAYMKQAAAKDYDLMMTFAEKRGSYVADVGVSIKDARGKTVFETKCDAPILLVDLPSKGSYRIHADAGGRTLDRTAVVKAGKGHARQLTFVWPNSVPAVPATSGKSEGTGRGSSGSDSYGTESSGSPGRDNSSGSENGNGNEGYSGGRMR